MARKPGHQCGCKPCRDGIDHPDRQDHAQLNALLDRLDEQQRRWLAGREAIKLGYGGISKVALICGLHHETIRRGMDELNAGLDERPTGRIRLPGGGRPKAEKKILC